MPERGEFFTSKFCKFNLIAPKTTAKALGGDETSLSNYNELKE